jgi:hypothetical protein
LAVFHISRQLFATGLFPDIEKAIGRPGTQINQGIGSYVGYAGDHTSEALNAYLGSGAQQFLVDRDGELWLITIRTATRPS